MSDSVVSLALISIKPGFNPRKFFDDKEFCELVSSVKNNGILQPILIRPVPGAETESYWVVAGERRCRAAIKAVPGENPEPQKAGRSRIGPVG